jgi:hypothetical protein
MLKIKRVIYMFMGRCVAVCIDTTHAVVLFRPALLSPRYFVNTLNWAAGDPPGLGNYELYLDRHSAHRHFILTKFDQKIRK